MTTGTTRWTIGIEEEYLLVDRSSLALVGERDPAFLAACREALGEEVSPELLQCQIEIDTPVCDGIAAARDDLRRLRRTVAEIALRFDMLIVAASTHPFSNWDEQRHTPTDRYRSMSREYQALARRAAVCGMHVHVAVGDDEQRIRLMNRLAPYLPLILALSTSSPFWGGHETGLKAFRPTMFGEFPRTGMPESFADWADWQAFLALMADTGVCPDPTKIWWDIRPSARHPTLEVRIAEVCTRLEDALTVAALCQSLCAWLADEPQPAVEDWQRYQRLLAEENKWRAQRWGAEAELADGRLRRLRPLSEHLDDLLGELQPHAQRLGCAAEVERARELANGGTSADEQLRRYRQALSEGATPEAALRSVTAWLATTTTKIGSPG